MINGFGSSEPSLPMSMLGLLTSQPLSPHCICNVFVGPGEGNILGDGDGGHSKGGRSGAFFALYRRAREGEGMGLNSRDRVAVRLRTRNKGGQSRKGGGR